MIKWLFTYIPSGLSAQFSCCSVTPLLTYWLTVLAHISHFHKILFAINCAEFLLLLLLLLLSQPFTGIRCVGVDELPDTCSLVMGNHPNCRQFLQNYFSQFFSGFYGSWLMKKSTDVWRQSVLYQDGTSRYVTACLLALHLPPSLCSYSSSIAKEPAIGCQHRLGWNYQLFTWATCQIQKLAGHLWNLLTMVNLTPQSLCRMINGMCWHSLIQQGQTTLRRKWSNQF